ncbi:MAG: histidinol-phosphate transaminase [Mariprofundaceae bacterium]
MARVKWSDRAVPQASGLHPYVPGKPVEQLLREKGMTEAIKLASNENPYGPPPKALAAIQKAAGEAHRYPDGDCTELKQALAGKHGIKPENILLGNGSNEVLELLIRTFAGPGDEVVYSARAFIVYALAAQGSGAAGVAVPESDGLSHDLDAMAAKVSGTTKMVCIANPNNPTGTLHTPEKLQAFLDRLPRHIIAIIDEAYYEYVTDQLGDSVCQLSHPGLVITRTFSKAYGLAGCRAGYAIADAGIVGLADRFREPFNVNFLAQSAAMAALEDEAWVIEKAETCKSERKRLEVALQEMAVLGGHSFGNFVLLRHAKAGLILQKLEDQGIIPRPLGPYGMLDYLRISVGTRQENERLLKVLETIMNSLQE